MPSSYFFRAVTLFEQQPFQICKFFSVLSFFQNSNFFRVKLLPSSYLLTIARSLGQLLFQNKDGGATFLKQAFLYSINFSRATTFSTKLILQKRYLLRKAGFLNQSIFQKSNIPELTFSEGVILHSCTSFPQLQFLFIS